MKPRSEHEELEGLREEMRQINRVLRKAGSRGRGLAGVEQLARKLATETLWNVQLIHDVEGLEQMLRQGSNPLLRRGCECGHYDWLITTLGHDGVGHRTANALKREGLFRLKDLRSRTDAELLELRNMGSGCMDRLHATIDHCDRWSQPTHRRP